MQHYDEIVRDSLIDPEAFWLKAGEEIDWTRPPTRAVDLSNPPFYRWFPDGELNVCHNALDRHVTNGRGENIAIVHDSPVTDSVTKYTYRQLLDTVTRFAGVLTNGGVRQGDRVVIYMPMIPEAIVAMLACARIGAIHSVVFGGFAPAELASRIDDAKPTAVIFASCGIEGDRVIEYKPLVDRALTLADHAPPIRIVYQRAEAAAYLGPDEIDWATAISTADPVPAVAIPSTDPLYILYTSGTTGQPKGIVRDGGGYAVALLWAMRNIFGIGPSDTIFTASDIGWIVGHSFIAYGPLLAGATTVLHEGKPVGTPDAGQFWRVAARHHAKVLFTAPTAVRAIRRLDPKGQLSKDHDLTALRAVFLAGERLDTDTYQWLKQLLEVPIVDNWWQTETGWPICANPIGLTELPFKPGSPTKPLPGWDVRIVDEVGQPAELGSEGAIVIKLPMPPGSCTTLWNADERFRSVYLNDFDGYYSTGDSGRIDEDGYLFVAGRTDDVINVAGHRLAAGRLEEVLAQHPAVAECAVIGVPDALKGQVPRAFVVLHQGTSIDEQTLQAQLCHAVRDQVGPIATLDTVTIVTAMPKTRSGKILRKTMRSIAEGRDTAVPATIEDPSVLHHLLEVLR